MKKIIPEVVNYYCDMCGKELVGSDKASNCKVIMSSDGLDFSGNAVGPGAGGKFDCCYSCYAKLLQEFKNGN